MIFRKAQLEDIEPLIELRKILIEGNDSFYTAKTKEARNAWRAAYRDWLIEYMQSNSQAYILVASTNSEPNTIAGCAIGIIDQRVPYPACLNGKVGWVQTVIVAPNFRKQGLAKKMMEQLFGWFSNKKIEMVTLQTTPMAEKLYKKMGFIDSGEPLFLKSLKIEALL